MRDAGSMKRSFLHHSFGLIALVAALAGQTAWAPAGTLGNMAGTVRDAKTGAPIAGVRLQITSPSQAVQVTTDAHGHFVVFSLQPDDYTVTAQKNGYDTVSFDGYSVFADQTQQYDLQLTPSSPTGS
jgi:hypothetical protein